jgi:hypothetical protein
VPPGKDPVDDREFAAPHEPAIVPPGEVAR